MMEIQHLRRSDIIDDDWNCFIDKTDQKIIYAKTWYLDQIPQDWESLAAFDNGELIGVLPYQIERKYRLKKVQQDAFTNELGIFCLKNREDCSEKLLGYFFSKNKFISIYKFNTRNRFMLNMNNVSFELTHHLTLGKPIEEIRSGYSKNLKRNLKKAKSNKVYVSENTGIESLIQLFKSNVAHKIDGIEEYQYDILRKIYETTSLKGLAKIYDALSPEGNLLSSALIINSGTKVIYFFAASSDQGKELNSQTLLIDQIIEVNCKSNQIFDFEGGTTEGLRRFYSGFGGEELKIPIYRRMFGERIFRVLKLGY